MPEEFRDSWPGSLLQRPVLFTLDLPAKITNPTEWGLNDARQSSGAALRRDTAQGVSEKRQLVMFWVSSHCASRYPFGVARQTLSPR